MPRDHIFLHVIKLKMRISITVARSKLGLMRVACSLLPIMNVIAAGDVELKSISLSENFKVQPDRLWEVLTDLEVIHLFSYLRSPVGLLFDVTH